MSSRRRWLVAVAASGLGGMLLVAWMVHFSVLGATLTDRKLERAVASLRARGLAAGYHPGIALPVRDRPLTTDGTVDLLKTADGRLIVLFKHTREWKGNYHGTIYSDAPIRPGEIGNDYYGRPAFRLQGLNSVIEKKAHNRRFEVFFDLG